MVSQPLARGLYRADQTNYVDLSISIWNSTGAYGRAPHEAVISASIWHTRLGGTYVHSGQFIANNLLIFMVTDQIVVHECF